MDWETIVLISIAVFCGVWLSFRTIQMLVIEHKLKKAEKIKKERYKK